MTSIRVSDAMAEVMAKHPGIERRPIPPVEETEAYRDVMRGIRKSRMRKAGLFGDAVTANCAEGIAAFDRAKEGHGTFMFGEPGRGKTYAASCCARLAIEAGWSVKVWPSAKMLAAVRAEFREPNRVILAHARSVDLLVLDDVGAENPTDWALETLTSLVDSRVSAKRPTVITSNFRLGDLRRRWVGIPGARLASRIAGNCEAVEFGGRDRRLDVWQI